METIFVEKMCKKYKKSEKFIKLLLKICDDNNILNKENTINEIYKLDEGIYRKWKNF